MSAVRGVIFDVDGTLIDSNDAHASAWVEAFHEAGFEVPFQQLRDMIGMGGDKIIPLVTGFGKDTDQACAIGDRRDHIFLEKYAASLKPFPRVRDLLLRMKSDSLGIYIATSSKPKQLRVLLEKAGVADLITEGSGKKEGERSKPDPDVVQAAVQESGLDPANLVLIGDTPYDIEAAENAAVRAIGFRSGGWPDDRLEGAVRIYDGTWDMLARYAGFATWLETETA